MTNEQQNAFWIHRLMDWPNPSVFACMSSLPSLSRSAIRSAMRGLSIFFQILQYQHIAIIDRQSLLHLPVVVCSIKGTKEEDMRTIADNNSFYWSSGQKKEQNRHRKCTNIEGRMKQTDG